jgi:hypothetical protein
MYIGPDVIDQLPQGQTQFKPGFTGPIQEPSREVFDMLHAASVKAQAVAQRKAVDAEQERLRSDWFLSQTAGQLRQFQAAAKAKNDFDKQMLVRQVAERVQAGEDPLSAIKSSGVLKYGTLSEISRSQPKPVVAPKQPFSSPDIVTIEGKKYRRQINPNTNQEVITSLGEIGAVPERERFLYQQKKDLETQLEKIGEQGVGLKPERGWIFGEPNPVFTEWNAKNKAIKDQLETVNRKIEALGGEVNKSPVQPGQPPKITTKEERDKLAVGTEYIGPDGKRYVRQ